MPRSASATYWWWLAKDSAGPLSMTSADCDRGMCSEAPPSFRPQLPPLRSAIVKLLGWMVSVTSSWSSSAQGAMDPVTFSIIRHRLFRVTDEAVITLKHVSGTAITNEGHDLMVGLYRADGSLLMGGLGFLNHMVYAAQACKVIIRRFAGDINENDIFLLNDPYTAAAHTSDIYLIAPIHFKGELVAWSACFVHIADIGALNPGGFSP